MPYLTEEKGANISVFRPIYLRPTLLSDEAVVVGLVFSSTDGLRLTKIEHPKALSNLEVFAGSGLAEQVQFALLQLKDALPRTGEDIKNLRSPNELLEVGDEDVFFAEDPSAYSVRFLRSVSSLYAGDFRERIKKTSIVPQKRIIFELKNAAGRLNVLEATRLFKGVKVELPGRKPFTFPIGGSKVIGSAVSFVTPQVGQAKNFAEASIVRLIYCAKKSGRKRPALYFLLPAVNAKLNSALVEDSVGEATLLADEYGVAVRQERDISDLAISIFKDEGVEAVS